MVAAMKTKPLSVEMGPPKLGMPVLPNRYWLNGARSSVVPNGTDQRILPLVMSMACNCPQGGGLQGVPNGDTKVWPVWPAGFHATLDHNRLSLYDPDDTMAVAVDGDHVRMSGASVPAGNFASEPCVPDSGSVAVVQSAVTVVP